MGDCPGNLQLSDLRVLDCCRGPWESGLLRLSIEKEHGAKLRREEQLSQCDDCQRFLEMGPFHGCARAQGIFLVQWKTSLWAKRVWNILKNSL